MIIIMRENKLNKEAARLLAKKDNDGKIIEPIQMMYEVDFKNITDDTLIILDITGDGEFQKRYPEKSLGIRLMECGLSPSINKIQIIVSDVDWQANPVVCIGRELTNYLEREGREVDVYSFDGIPVGGPTSISIVTKDDDVKEWQISRYSPAPYFNGSSKNGSRNKELWSGPDIRDKLEKHYHHNVNHSPSGRS